MKILLSSHAFFPQVGGIETASWLLAHAFAEAGDEVKIVTATSEDGGDGAFPFTIVRQPSWRVLLELVQWCDLFFHNNISLRAIWPLLLWRRPWVVTSQTWIGQPDGTQRWSDRLKRALLCLAHRVSISEAIANDTPRPSALIPNPYDNEKFRILPGATRDRDFIFVGRLVSDKGVDLLLHALKALKLRGYGPLVTIVGSGPEEQALRALAAGLGLHDQVTFAGKRMGEDLVSLLNAHKVLIVPSRWAEPFGIVALEGIACGCAVIASEGGGLKEAVGRCGMLFPNGDATALADAMAEHLRDNHLLTRLRDAAEEHLPQFWPENVAQRYRALFERVKS